MKEIIEDDFALSFQSVEDIKGFGKTEIYNLDSIIRGSISGY
jgi:hypothetical protein